MHSYRSGFRIRHACLIAALVLAPAMAAAQSGANPFGRVPPSQINALRIWDRLPPQIKRQIETRIAPLTEDQRRQLLTSIPALRSLTPAQFDAILTQLEATIPLPVTELVTAAFEPQNPAGVLAWQPDYRSLDQTFTATESGTLDRIFLMLTRHPFGTTTDRGFLMLHKLSADGGEPIQIIKAIGFTADNLSSSDLGAHWVEFDPSAYSSVPQIEAGAKYRIRIQSASLDPTVNFAPIWWGEYWDAGHPSSYLGGEGTMHDGRPEGDPNKRVVDYGFRVRVKK